MAGHVNLTIEGAIARIEFAHPKANSLPLSLLDKLSEAFRQLDSERGVRVVLLSSEGDKTFCAGASFEEFERVSTKEEAIEFFSGFAKVILAMKKCSAIVVTRVQGKAVGGGVGLIAASDYVFAKADAAIRLSEFELDLGPFTIGPAVERKTGPAAFSSVSIDCCWRDADWCLNAGLFSANVNSLEELKKGTEDFAKGLEKRSNSAVAELKKMLWEGTESWDQLLFQRAATTAALLIERKSRDS